MMKIKIRRSRKSWGFTIVELLVVMIMVGILATIAAPAWQGFLNNQRLGTAQNEVYLAIREAQSNAKKTKQQRWYAVFRVLPSGQSQFSVLKIAENINIDAFSTTSCDSFPWKNLESSIRISYTPNNSVGKRFGDCSSNIPGGVRGFDFDKNGNAAFMTNQTVAEPGVRIRTANGGGRRCVVVTTILGATRQLSETDSGCPA